MKIVSFYGKPDCGKSSTMIMLMERLLQNGATVVDSQLGANVTLQEISACLRPTGSARDIWLVVDYNGKRIGVTARGDYPINIQGKPRYARSLSEDLDEFIARKCDEAFCASHDSTTFRTVLNNSSNQGDVILIRKPFVTDVNGGAPNPAWVQTVNESAVDTLWRFI